MNLLVVLAGTVAGLGVFLIVGELVPGRTSLDAALARLGGAGHAALPSVRSAGGRLASAGGRAASAGGRVASAGGRMASALPWLPAPAADLALLGQDRERWLASKIVCGLVGLGIVPACAVVLAAVGDPLGLAVPAAVTVAIGLALFFAPDLVTHVNAAEKRADFRHALTSYLDLVGLERGAGAGPTEALEAAAEIGGGWAFARIGTALAAARNAGRPPWEGLAALAEQTGISELADLAEIAEVAGQEGGRILQTLAARAESMRAEALAATKAKAGARSTTMVIPVALLAAGFLLLLIFPIAYRTFG